MTMYVLLEQVYWLVVFTGWMVVLAALPWVLYKSQPLSDDGGLAKPVISLLYMVGVVVVTVLVLVLKPRWAVNIPPYLAMLGLITATISEGAEAVKYLKINRLKALWHGFCSFTGVLVLAILGALYLFSVIK